jgi:hypothetical protein
MPLTPSQSAGPRRRSLLAGTLSTLSPLGALGVLGTTTGCSSGNDSADSAQVTRAELRLRQEAAQQSRELLERYEATAAAHSGLTDRLRPLRAETRRHAEALAGRSEKGKKDDGAEGDSGKDGKPGKAAVPGDEKAALAALGEAERRTSEARTAALVKAPPELARLLASVAAAGAAHAFLLGVKGQGDEEDEGA